MSYFLLDGAYNEVSLYNSPDPVQNMKYPCLVSYPFLSQFSPSEIDLTPLRTDYESMNKSYQAKPCAYCDIVPPPHGT